MINVKEIKIKPFYKRLLCFHKYTSGIRVIHDKSGKKRHAWICTKCGDRIYID